MEQAWVLSTKSKSGNVNVAAPKQVSNVPNQGNNKLLKTVNDALTYIGYGATAAVLLQKSMKGYRQSLSIDSKIGTFLEFSAKYKTVGIAGKVAGTAGNAASVLTVVLDYQAYNKGDIARARFDYRLAGTGVGIGVYVGAVPAMIVGGGVWAGEKSYDGFNKCMDLTSKYISNINRGILNGWVPGK